MSVLILWFILLVLLPVLYTITSKRQDEKKYMQSHYYSSTKEEYKSVKTNKGKLGEYSVTEELSRLGIDENIFTNIYLFDETGYSTEIDIVFVHTSGIYVIEAKNYSGWVYGNEKQKYWREVFYSKKYPFLNPIWQNNRHIDFLKKQLYITDKNVFKSYIVFTGRSHLKSVPRISSEKYDTCILELENLVTTICCRTFNKDILTQGQVEKISGFLGEHSNMDPMIKENHISLLKQTH